MNKLEELSQGWKCHMTRPVDCKNCPYFGGNSNKGCWAGLEKETFTFISDMLEEKMKGMSADEIMARFFD